MPEPTAHPLRRLFTILVAALLGAGVVLALTARRAAAQEIAAPRPGDRVAAVLLIRGNDTLVVERIQRTGSRVTAVIAGRGTPRLAVTSELAPSHLVSSASFTIHGAGSPTDAEPLQTGSVRFVQDSVHLTVRAGEREQPMRIGSKRDALLIVNNDVVAVEQLVRRARMLGLTKLALPLFSLAGGATIDGTLEFLTPDSVRFTIGPSVAEFIVDGAGNVTRGILPAAGIRVAVVEGPAAAAISIGRPDYSALADAPYTAEDVTLRTPAGHTLAGTLTLPKGATGKVAAVVTITGSGAQDRDEHLTIVPGFRLFRQVADTLGRRGIAVLRLDDRGVGGSGGSVHGTSADFADDIRAAVAYLRGRPEVDGARIALVGHSEGGLIAPMVAATDPRLAAIVLMAGPAQTGRQIIDYQVALGVRSDTNIAPAKLDSAIAAARTAFDTTTGQLPWFKFFLAHDPVATLRKLRLPVLVLHGATDRQVTVEQAEVIGETLRAAGNRRTEVRIFPDRNHLFLQDPDGSPIGYAKLKSGRVDGEVMGALADWLSTRLN